MCMGMKKRRESVIKEGDRKLRSEGRREEGVKWNNVCRVRYRKR